MYICGYGSSVCMLIPHSIVYFVMFMHIGGILSGGLCPGGIMSWIRQDERRLLDCPRSLAGGGPERRRDR